jgi:hypothetical protein
VGVHLEILISAVGAKWGHLMALQKIRRSMNGTINAASWGFGGTHQSEYVHRSQHIVLPAHRLGLFEHTHFTASSAGSPRIHTALS